MFHRGVDREDRAARRRGLAGCVDPLAAASGGTPSLAYGTALTIAVGYVIIGPCLAGAVVTRRDITDQASGQGWGMTGRGASTRTRLLEATTRVVREVGYAHASTRAIAQAAGVAEGTIYRHFPDKASMFFAAILKGSEPVVAWMSELPARAGHGTVSANLTECLARLSLLRDEVLPLELAMLTDPELARQHPRTAAVAPPGLLPGPPDFLARYLAAEQRLGRVRAEIDPAQAAVTILATLFGLGLMPSGDGSPVDEGLLAAAVGLLTTGLEPASPGDPAGAGPGGGRR